MIKLRNFQIEPLNMENIEHYKLVSKLQDDKKTNDYISKNLINWIKEPEGEKFLLGKTYVIEKDNLSIGLFGTISLQRNGNLEMWYDLLPCERGQGNGSHFVGEITPYLIEKVHGLEDVELKINKNNIASNKVAINNGYILNHSELDTNVYYYFNEEGLAKTSKK